MSTILELLTRVPRLDVTPGAAPVQRDPVALDKMPVIRVLADDVHRLYWQDERTFSYNDDAGCFGPVRAPFDRLWVEGLNPRRRWVQGQWGDGVEGERTAADVFAGAQADRLYDAFVLRRQDGRVLTPGTESAPTTNADQRLVMALYQLIPGQPPIAWQGLYFVGVDDDGTVRGRVVIGGGTDPGPLAEILDCLAGPALLTIGLMNCRNVQVDDVEQRKLPKKTKRGRPAQLRYSRVLLPGAPTTISEAHASSGGAVPLHLVRGHFKTYTADAPLFGSQTGTWWWGWQARGSKKRGVVVPTYEVKDAR